MSRTTLETKDGGHMAFGIDGMLNCWFAMVTRPDEDTPFIYEPSTDKDTLCALISDHAVDGPEKDAKLLAVALDIDPAGAR